ncbi:Asr1405/Asl0597 family protein [Leptolyngbya iicbica]|uniref:Uncharacterized protein n=2 Tax=Cyanophyceae TaxID=3028117 RepID=A0A4Q7E300_9CYAN|nr:Asr1405/Asl0597 family protein [Leptolyngbya sp. LK]RZM75671.1 hypothetical protein DYY88_20435 [Leptolyngbya sp. LK]
MNNPHSATAVRFAVSSIQRCDRWSIYHRLQELNIPCACPADGTLRLEVNHAVALILARSTVQQFTTTFQEQRDWLDRCWHTSVLSHPPVP